MTRWTFAWICFLAMISPALTEDKPSTAPGDALVAEYFRLETARLARRTDVYLASIKSVTMGGREAQAAKTAVRDARSRSAACQRRLNPVVTVRSSMKSSLSRSCTFSHRRAVCHGELLIDRRTRPVRCRRCCMSAVILSTRRMGSPTATRTDTSTMEPGTPATGMRA